MLKRNFDKLMEDPLVYYIYQVGPPIYGLPGDPTYIVITNDDWKRPDDSTDEENPKEVIVDLYKMSEWFNMVNSGSLTAWICACLNKKFIKKEYVKLMMTTNPIQLRSDILMEKFTISGLLENPEEIPSDINDRIFDLVAHTLFAEQILENHKIVNFKEPAKYFNDIQQTTEFDQFNEFYMPILAPLKKATDGIWIKHLKDKAYAKINSTTGSSSERKVDMGEGVCEDSQGPCDSEQG